MLQPSPAVTITEYPSLKTVVYGFTRMGKQVRLLCPTPADSELPAGWEIGVRNSAYGWELEWLPDFEIVRVEVSSESEDEEVGFSA